MIPDTEELFVANDFSVEAFSKTIFRGFEEWSSGSKISEYEANWMEYPKQELFELSLDAMFCSFDYYYPDLESALADWTEQIDEQGWIHIGNPLPNGQIYLHIILEIILEQ